MCKVASARLKSTTAASKVLHDTAPADPSTSHISLFLPQPRCLLPVAQTPRVISTLEVFTVASSRTLFSDYFPVRHTPGLVSAQISPQRRPLWPPHLADHPPLTPAVLWGITSFSAPIMICNYPVCLLGILKSVSLFLFFY